MSDEHLTSIFRADLSQAGKVAGYIKQLVRRHEAWGTAVANNFRGLGR
jgi:hypothetical protein